MKSSFLAVKVVSSITGHCYTGHLSFSWEHAANANQKFSSTSRACFTDYADFSYCTRNFECGAVVSL